MKIVGFPIDVSRSQDGRIVRGLRTRQALIQSTLDLIQAYYQLDERPRRRLLDLAKSLHAGDAAAA